VVSGAPGYGTKGSSAFSEAESIILKNRVEVAHPDIAGFIDAHSFVTGPTANAYRYVSYNPYWGLAGNRDTLTSLAAALVDSPDDPVAIDSESPKPGYINWTANKGIESFVLEWDLGSHGGGEYSSKDMTKAVEWYGNAMLKMGAVVSGSRRVDSIGDVKILKAAAFALPVGEPNGTYPLVLPEYIFYAEVDSVIELTGWATITSSLDYNRVYLSPYLGQDAMFPSSFRASRSNDDWVTHDFIAGGSANKRFTLPLSRTVVVRGGDKYPIRLSLMGAGRDGAGTVEQLYMTLSIRRLSSGAESLSNLTLVDGELRQRAPYFEAANGDLSV
jgi:hypothetical protein